MWVLLWSYQWSVTRFEWVTAYSTPIQHSELFCFNQSVYWMIDLTVRTRITEHAQKFVMSYTTIQWCLFVVVWRLYLIGNIWEVQRAYSAIVRLCTFLWDTIIIDVHFAHASSWLFIILITNYNSSHLFQYNFRELYIYWTKNNIDK
jgi:hypothetical protein